MTTPETCPKCGAGTNEKASLACAPFVHYDCGSNTSGVESDQCVESRPTYTQLAAANERIAQLTAALTEISEYCAGECNSNFDTAISRINIMASQALGPTP